MKSIGRSRLFEVVAAMAALRSAPLPPASAPSGALPSKSRGMKILLVEDDGLNQKIALRILSKRGFEADVVASGLAAIQALERQPYDLVLLDIEMPGIDGLETARRICARFARANRPYLIAMTAHALDGDRERCLAAGMDDYTTKPVEPAALFAAFERAASVSAGKVPKPRLTESASAELRVAASAIDSSQVTRLIDMVGKEEAAQLAEAFQQDAQQRFAAMTVALKYRDASALRAAAHTLRQMSAAFGAQALVLRCAEVEALEHIDDASHAEEVIKAAREALPPAYAALRRTLLG